MLSWNSGKDPRVSSWILIFSMNPEIAVWILDFSVDPVISVRILIFQCRCLAFSEDLGMSVWLLGLNCGL